MLQSKTNSSISNKLFPNKLLSPEKIAHPVLLLFYPFRDEKDLLSGLPPMYQNKVQEEQVQDVIKINKMKFEPHGDLLNQAFVQLNEILINNQDPYSQIEMMKHQRQNTPRKVI